jgi:hypothetical protein
MMSRWILVASAALLVVAASCDGARTEPVSTPQEGDQAPGFSLPSAGGGSVALADFAGKKPVLLYFSMGPG